MSELTGIVYAEFETVSDLNAFNQYFDFDSRPRFIEDAPDDQHELVEIAEFIEYPQEVKNKGGTGRFYFYWFEEMPEDTISVISQLGEFFKAKKLFAYVQDDEEYREYFQLATDKLAKERLKSVYSVGEEQHPNYSAMADEKLESLEYDEKALFFIVEKFSN